MTLEDEQRLAREEDEAQALQAQRAEATRLAQNVSTDEEMSMIGDASEAIYDMRGSRAILTVGSGCTYATIQDAVTAAAVTGDEIWVAAETFTGINATVNINGKSLDIRGGANATCTALGAGIDAYLSFKDKEK